MGNTQVFWPSLQYSCLEKSMDRRAWWVTVHRVSKWLKQLIMYTCLSWQKNQSRIYHSPHLPGSWTLDHYFPTLIISRTDSRQVEKTPAPWACWHYSNQPAYPLPSYETAIMALDRFFSPLLLLLPGLGSSSHCPARYGLLLSFGNCEAHIIFSGSIICWSVGITILE